MRPRDRKIQDDLKSNPTRSILVVLAIAVGLFAMGVIMTMYLSLPVDMRVGYERTNPANIYFHLSDFDNSLIKHVKNWDEVRDAMGGSTAELRVRDKDQVLHSVTVQAVSDDSWPINHLKLLEGTWPLAKGEVALENYKFDQLGLKIGDRVVFKTETGKEVLLTIRARVRDQSIGASNYNNVFMVPINAYISTGSLRLLDMSEEWNMLRIVVNGDANDQPWIEQVANAASTNLEKAGFQIYSTTIFRQSAHPTADYADAIASTLLLIGILVLFLSGTLTYNTISAILSSQMRQIGAMKTFGATYFQIVAMYMRLIFIYSLIALAIAIPTSFLVANICSEFLAEKINFEIQQKGIIWQTIILQIMLGLIIPQVAGFIPVSKGAKVSIRQALSGMNSGTGDDTKPSAGMTWMTRVFSRPTALSLRNTFRKKMRLFLTLFTLSLGGAIFIGTFNVIEAIDHHIISIGRYFQADLDVTTTVPYRSDRMTQSLSAVSGVKMVEGWGAGSATLITDDDIDGPSVSVIAPPDDSALIFPKMKSGRWFIPGERNAIVLSERFHHSYPELKEGDSITLDVNKTGEKTEWTITGFFTMAGKSGGFIAYIPYDSWTKVSGVAARITKFEVVTNKKMKGTELKRYADSLGETLDAMGYDIKSVTGNDSFVSDSASGLNVMAAFMLIMALLVSLVGSIGLTGTMSLNVMERTSEIGILRAIGASDKAVMRNVLTEGLMIGLMSCLFGSLMSVPVGRLLTNAMGTAIFGSTLESAFTWEGYVFWLAISIIFSLLASIVPARKAVKLTIREVLSVE